MTEEEKINYPASIAVNAGILGAGLYAINRQSSSKNKYQNKVRSSLQRRITKVNLANKLHSIADRNTVATAKASQDLRLGDLRRAEGLAKKRPATANRNSIPFSKNVKYLGDKGRFQDPRYASKESLVQRSEKVTRRTSKSMDAAYKLYENVAKPTRYNTVPSQRIKVSSTGQQNIPKFQRAIKTMGKVIKTGGVAGAILSAFDSKPAGMGSDKPTASDIAIQKKYLKSLKK